MSDPKSTKEKGNAFRGSTAVMSHATEDNSLNFSADQMSAKSAPSQQQTASFGGKSNEIITLELDEAGAKSKSSQKAPENIFAIEVVQEDSTELFNEISSFSVQDTNCAQVIGKLSTILSSYSAEIDFEVDSDKNEIKNGVVFVNNYYGVYFTIWTLEAQDKSTKFQFQRQSGDAMAAAKFLGDIQAQFFGTKEAENTLIALDLNMNDLEMKVSEEQKERMMVHEALLDDEVVGDSLEESAENYLFQKLIDNKAIDSKNVVDHKVLCKTLIDKSMLLHSDIAVVRASLLILKKFANVYYELLAGKATFSLLNEVLKEQKCGLIKTYVVQLLAALAASKEDNWDLAETFSKSLKEQIEKVEAKNKTSKFYEKETYDIVYKKLNA